MIIVKNRAFPRFIWSSNSASDLRNATGENIQLARLALIRIVNYLRIMGAREIGSMMGYCLTPEFGINYLPRRNEPSIVCHRFWQLLVMWEAG